LKPRHLIIVLALSGSLFYGGQLIFPLAIAMGDNLSDTQQKQRDDAKPEVEVAPPMRACDGIPSGYEGHEELPYLLFTAAISFLVGFKIAAWMGRRQIERLSRIWRQ